MEIKPFHKRYRDEEKRETIFELHIPDSFVSSVKSWKFTILLELSALLADPEDFIQ
jgi:hypothetical protein